MIPDIESIGAIQVLQNSGNPVAGLAGITVDIPNGPVHTNDAWLLDSAALFYSTAADNNGFLPEEITGLFIVPVGSPPINDVVGNLDAQNRGISLPYDDIPGSPTFGPPDTIYASQVFTGESRIIPYGYTLRAYWGYNPNNNPPVGKLSLICLVRKVTVCP